MYNTIQELKKLKKSAESLSQKLKYEMAIFEAYKKATKDYSERIIKARGFTVQKYVLLREAKQYIDYAINYLKNYGEQDCVFVSYIKRIETLITQHKEKADFYDGYIEEVLNDISSSTEINL